MNEERPVIYTEFEIGEGTIEAKEHQLERLDEVTRRLASGEFHGHAYGDIVCKCIDGRHGGHIKGANSAGGTETITVADDLSAKRFSDIDGTIASAHRKTLQFLGENGHPIGGHTDDHATGDASGCGANDMLPQIYDFIVKHPDKIRALAGMMGIDIADETHQLILTNAAARESFSKGSELLDELMEIGGDEAVDKLQGSHHEVVLVINKRRGTTLDREALEAEFGPDYQAFNVDVWAFESSARAVAANEADVEPLIAGMAYYNLATGGVLCGKKMHVVILE